MEQVKEAYDKWGALLILVKGVTPIPYKLVTIVSGLLHYNFPLFVLLSLITRGARFFLLAGALNLFGDRIRDGLERYFGLFLVLLVLFIVLGFWAAAKLV
jgi:membrane protein YqaA with SNARE-associated domain